MACNAFVKFKKSIKTGRLNTIYLTVGLELSQIDRLHWF